MEWWDRDDTRETSARLIDISEGGALLVAENPPPLHQSVWLRFETPTATDWVKADVVRLAGAAGLGVAFPQGCPDDFTMAAVLGFNLDALITRPMH